jgi:hypothetical protein
MRKDILRTLIQVAGCRLTDIFGRRDFEDGDLYGFDFGNSDLSGLSFKGSFLVEARFHGILTDANFTGVYIRNADFRGTSLSNTDFSSADWFNATGLTADQLKIARTETLIDCPPDVKAIHRYLSGRYGSPFDSWSAAVQEALKSTWKEYLRPGGLREVVMRWKLARMESS